jgi:HSP20 family protein
MTTIVRRSSPQGEYMTLRQAMDRFFDDDVFRPLRWGNGAAEGPRLPLDVTTTADALVVEASLPGIKPEDVEITVENGTLTIAAESRDERTEKNDQGEVLVQEIRRGSLSRSITLPTGLEPDKANASFENGVLRLDIPIAETVKPRQIRISPTTNGQSQALETGDQPATESATGQGA